MAELVFKTELKEVSVEIDGKDYVLKELDGAGQSQWRKASGGQISVVDNKPTVTGLNFDDIELRLLSICLYDTDGKLVPKSVMSKWNANTLSALFDAAQELSGLNKLGKEKLEAEAKNS